MLAHVGIDDRFLDRPGCGDELYLDLHFRAAMWLESLAGDDAADRDADLMGDDGDDAASH